MHCESCGTPNPSTDPDGYTTCCNELPCYASVRSAPFAVELADGRMIAVRACCWASVDRQQPGNTGGHADCSGCAIHRR